MALMFAQMRSSQETGCKGSDGRMLCINWEGGVCASITVVDLS